MISIDCEPARPACTVLEWETGFFGVRIGRIDARPLNATALEAALAWRATNQVRALTCLVDADDPDAAHLLERAGFLLADIRVTLARSVARGDGDVDAAQSAVRSARAEDVSPLAEIASQNHTGTRFTADPYFRPHAERFYRTWVERSVDGFADELLVAEHGARPVGYLSLKMEAAGVGAISLIGVAESARRLGIGASLINHGLVWCARQDATEVRVVTQGRNIAAQRLFQRGGFRTRSVELWFHRWWDA